MVAHYNRSNDSLKQLDRTPNFSAIQADLTNELDVVKLFDSIGDNPIQVLVVNHGIWPNQDVPIAQMTLEQWNKTISTNLTASFLIVREFLRRLDKPNVSESIRDRASVIFIGSTAGKYGEAGHADYAASKSGMIHNIIKLDIAYTFIFVALMYGFLLSLKNEIVKIAPKGRVNCVAPGWVRTPMAEQALANPDIVYRALATCV